MYALLWLVPAFPLSGFLILVLLGRRLSARAVKIVGVGSVALSAAVAAVIGITFLLSPPAGSAYVQTLWIWLDVAECTAAVAFYLDAVSLLMILVVTWVALLIHIYATAYMEGDEGYSRFFAYMNLFVAAMLILVLADNLLLLYLGWEGVGLCSYLLIGFWYREPANGRAARKAFLVTRVGDTAMAVGLFLLFHTLGTLDIQDVMQRALAQWPVGSGLAVAAAALLLSGAVGKSAQLPLQTWLPDAMAGPTPVSALIHAATMVTAGVYLIVRLHVLFMLAPGVQTVVAVVGAATLLLAGCSALVQRDIKRVLAYSTISQIGYMFLALGVGAWSAAMFHFMTHAFFKALLFLGAGVVISALHEEHDMFKMGGLRRQLPVTFWTFLIGSASLAAVPLITAGFYSKDLILSDAWGSPAGSIWLWEAGLVGALLTSLYTFRMVFLTFFGRTGQEVSRPPGWAMKFPLIVLAILSLVGGFIEIPRTMCNVPLLSEFLQSALPPTATRTGIGQETALQCAAGLVSLLGIYLAYVMFLRRPQLLSRLTTARWGADLRQFWFEGWGFDRLYDTLLVRPYFWLAKISRRDIFDIPSHALSRLSRVSWYLLSQTQTGSVRWYTAAVVVGAAIVIAIMVIL